MVVVVVVAEVVNMARFGMAWHGLFFERGRHSIDTHCWI